MNTSPLLSELIVVREWLHDTAPHPQNPEATTGYSKFTKHSVMQALRTGSAYRDGLVREMDPDAANRGDGRAFAADDAVSQPVKRLSNPEALMLRRITKRALFTACTRMFGLESSRMLSRYAEKRISLGARLVSGDPYCSNGALLVCLPI
jgi:hypothetical protein